MRLIREAIIVLIAALIGVVAITVAFFINALAMGSGAGGWEMALGMLFIIAFWPLVGTTAVARSFGLLFRHAESWRYSATIALAMTGALLLVLDLLFSFNRNWGTVVYVGLALLGSAISAMSVTLINNEVARQTRR